MLNTIQCIDARKCDVSTYHCCDTEDVAVMSPGLYVACDVGKGGQIGRILRSKRNILNFVFRYLVLNNQTSYVCDDVNHHVSVSTYFRLEVNELDPGVVDRESDARNFLHRISRLPHLRACFLCRFNTFKFFNEHRTEILQHEQTFFIMRRISIFNDEKLYFHTTIWGLILNISTKDSKEESRLVVLNFSVL